MKGILALCAQDVKRLVANALFWIICVMLVVIIVFVNFVIPAEPAAQNFSLITYNTGLPSDAESREALLSAVKGGDAVGIAGNPDGTITVVHTGLSKKSAEALVYTLFARDRQAVKLKLLNENLEAVPWNKRLIPVFICCEAMLIGFILGGALLLSEKESRTICALRISPMGTDRYLLAKTLLFSIIGTLYSLLIAVFTAGFGFAFFPFILLSFLASALFSMIGVAFACFFKEMGSWFFALILLLAVVMLPIAGYVIPSFSPAWMKLFPSYGIIFAYEAILFDVGRSGLSGLLGVLLWCGASYPVCRPAAARRLMKGAGAV